MARIDKQTNLEGIKRQQKWVFPMILLVFWGACSWPSIAFESPYGKHQWRQCDAYSMALNYFHEDLEFFRPEMHFQHGNGTGSGAAVGEFTATYWLNAKAWKIFGLQPFTMRWTHMFLWLLGCWALFALGRNLFGPMRSAFATTFVLASPLVVFYAPSYLVNVSAMGMVFVGWWASWRILKGKRTHFFLEVILFTALSLSVLLRPTMVLGWLPIAVWAFAGGRTLSWLPRLAAPLALGIVWVLWSKAVNFDAGSLYFLTSVRPLWGAEEIGSVWQSFREDVLPEWYHLYVRVSMFAALVAVFCLKRNNTSEPDSLQLPRTERNGVCLTQLILLMVLGLSVYFVLWFENLDVHDYYLIEFQLLTPLVIWWLMDRLSHIRLQKPRFHLVIWGVLIATLSFQLLESHLRTRMKYVAPTGLLSELILTQRDRDIWSWFHWDQENRFAKFGELQKQMRAYGIRREDRIVSVPDPSPNITLALLDQKGFTDLYDDNMKGDERIRFYVDKGASYLVCNSSEWIKERAGSPWLTHPIIAIDNLVVFDLLNSESPLLYDAKK
jgi:hypothetical protein